MSMSARQSNAVENLIKHDVLSTVELVMSFLVCYFVKSIDNRL
jgi:hypothetical protein